MSTKTPQILGCFVWSSIWSSDIYKNQILEYHPHLHGATMLDRVIGFFCEFFARPIVVDDWNDDWDDDDDDDVVEYFDGEFEEDDWDAEDDLLDTLEDWDDEDDDLDDVEG